MYGNQNPVQFISVLKLGVYPIPCKHYPKQIRWKPMFSMPEKCKVFAMWTN